MKPLFLGHKPKYLQPSSQTGYPLFHFQPVVAYWAGHTTSLGYKLVSYVHISYLDLSPVIVSGNGKEYFHGCLESRELERFFPKRDIFG
jgi:hypothetical protein